MSAYAQSIVRPRGYIVKRKSAPLLRHPQPVKHVRYPWGFPRSKPTLTLAIGMLHVDGILLCADTLVSTPTLASYESKIMGYQLHDAYVVFAFAGGVDLAENAIQQCAAPLKAVSAKAYTSDQIKAVVDKKLSKEYRDNIVDAGLRYSDNDYTIIAAIWSARDGLRLCQTHGTAMKDSRTGLQCIGAGAEMAQVLIRQSYRASISDDRAWRLAASAMVNVKAAMPGSVGGNPVMMRLTDKGRILYYGYKDFSLAEKFNPWFDGEVGELKYAFMGDDDAEFDAHLERFRQIITLCRNQRMGERVPWSSPPPQAQGAIVDLR